MLDSIASDNLPRSMSEPIPVCCALIEHDGKVLIARRPPEKHLGGRWEFPGGKIEYGETPTVALHREITEELGCHLELTTALPPVIHAYPGTTIQLHPFVARLAAGSLAPRALEHTDLRWIDPAEFSTVALAPADIPVVTSYLNLSV